MAPLDSMLEAPRNCQETAKRLESRVESPRGSSRLVDPCLSRQELDAKRLEPGSSPLGSCTTLVPLHITAQTITNDQFIDFALLSLKEIAVLMTLIT